MKVNNVSIFVGDNSRAERHGRQQAQEKKTGGNIFAGDLNKCFDPIAQKKKQAREQAMKIVSDTFAGDKKIDDDMNARREKIKELKKENVQDQKTIREIEDQRTALRESMGVAEDSREEQDLKLLEKEIDAKMPGKKVTLTREEYERIEEIKKNGLTDYQRGSLDLKEAEGYYEKLIYERDNQIKVENAVIQGTKLERLKKDPMVKAQRQADEIMEAASREIVGMLMDEAKDHVDEEMEEKKEAAKEKAEEEKELEEKLEKTREKKEKQEELTEDIIESTEQMLELDDVQEDIQQEVKDMLNKMKLLEEDIKGAAVDEVL